MSSLISRSDAAAHLLRRRKARRSLIDFTSFTNAGYRAAAHHHLIANELEAILRGENDRLMIWMPPRHGKSELCTRRFPAFALGLASEPELASSFDYKVPADLTLMSASYNIDKAREFGGEVRDIVRQSAFLELFPRVSLKEDTRAKEDWRTDQGGFYVSAGVGTALTGRGTVGPIILIDDPLKDRAEADSEVRRTTVKNWYSSVVLSRFPRAIVIVQTRWHDDDLSGWQLEEMARGGDQWRILELPAINDKGEALWPEFYPIESLNRLKASTIPRDWSALFQQRPAPDEGDYFKREWVQYYGPDEKPARLRTYGVSDFAVTADGGDFTVHVVFGLDSQDNVYVLDVWRAQTSADQWIEAQIDMIAAHRPLMWVGEAGQIEKSIGPFLTKRMRERKTYCRVEALASVADKPTRARSFQARMAQRKIFLPVKGEHTEAMVNELLVFPAGKHDDCVDALGMVGRVLDELVRAASPKTPTKVQSSGYKPLRKEGGDGWQTA